MRVACGLQRWRAFASRGAHWRYRRVGVEQSAQIVVQEDTVRVERRAHPAEVVPVGIACGERRRVEYVHFAPVRPPAVRLIDRLYGAEVALVWHALVHMDRDIGRLAPICG